MEDGNATVPNFDMNHSFFWKINDTSKGKTKNAYKGSNSNAVLLVLLKKFNAVLFPGKVWFIKDDEEFDSHTEYSEVCLNLMREDRGGGHHPHPTPSKFKLFINIVKLPKIGFVNPPPPGKHNHLLDPPFRKRVHAWQSSF